MTPSRRPVHGSPDKNICNVAAAPIANAVEQSHTSTTSPTSMKEAAVRAREIRVLAGHASGARAVTA
jgi:hypothetical protein